MNLQFLVSLILLLQVNFGSISPTNSTKNNSVVHAIKKQPSERAQIIHTDSTFGYRVEIPNWWDIKETPSPNFFGGTFPEIDKSKSALIFKAFQKEKFKTIENFENWVIGSYKSGDSPKWSKKHIIMFRKPLSEFVTIGNAYKVQLKVADTFYNSCYIIVETSKSYLWIDLTATRETYHSNFKKLENLMLKFSTL